MDCGVGNSRMGRCGIPVGFRVFGGERWVAFDGGRNGRVAGDVGEIGGRILEDSGGVLGVGSQLKEEAEVWCFLVDF